VELGPAARVKPRLRGVSHLIGFLAAVPLGVALTLEPDTGRARAAAAVFAISVATMFGASALYHRPTWSPRWRPWLRRLDHAGVYGLIAGSYTPFGLIVLHGAWRTTVLAIVWAGALGAIVLRFAWVGAPKWLGAVFGIALGWVGVVVYPQLVHRLGIGPALLLLAAGLSYTAGAIVYARGTPDPVPGVFGYHELFHVLVIVAVALQYAVIAFFVLPLG
jgi:hemolysin III